MVRYSFFCLVLGIFLSSASFGAGRCSDCMPVDPSCLQKNTDTSICLWYYVKNGGSSSEMVYDECVQVRTDDSTCDPKITTTCSACEPRGTGPHPSNYCYNKFENGALANTICERGYDSCEGLKHQDLDCRE